MPKHKEHLPEFDAPKKKLISEHDQHVKALLQTQQNVETNLKIELQRHKHFETGAECFPSNPVAGTSSLRELQEEEHKQQEVNKLLSYGLTEYDITLYQTYNNGGLEHVQSEYSHHEPDLLKKKIDFILNTITQKQKQHQSMILPHPMNDIKKLELDLLDSHQITYSSQDVNKIRRNARKASRRLQSACDVASAVASSSSHQDNQNQGSMWDKTECTTPNDQPKILVQKRTTPHTCSKQHFYTIKDGEIVKINNAESMCQITGKMSVEEIKKLPQFANYAAGTPTNVLYVKNLPRKTTTDDLKRYFKDISASEYKIMTGKMRGQAFMTFDSIATASKVLSTSNGFVINEKPVVLQFAKGVKDL